MSGDQSRKRNEPEGSASPSADQLNVLLQVISRSQQNYRELVDHLDQAVFTLTLDGEVRAANVRLSEIFGVAIKDLIGRSLAEFIESPSLADAQRVLPDFLKKGSWEGTLTVRLHHDPAVRFFKCWFMPLYEEGEPASICGWARDITKQYESELRFTEFFDSVREGLFFSMPSGEILDVNPALVRMLGYDSKDELKKINFRDIYSDPGVRDGLVRETLEKGAVQDREIVLKRKDGSLVHCLASGFPIRDSAGRVIRLQGTLVDFTERLEIERRLHKEQEFVRRLVASIPDMIAVIDCSGKFTYVSQKAHEVLGYAPEELVGQQLGGRTHADDLDRLQGLFRRLVSGLTTESQLEYRTTHKDGSWRTLRASAAPIFDEAGRISGVVATARDVTEQVQVEQQLAQREKFTAMGQMLTGAAHELNNPLTAILGVSELIRERSTDEATRRHADLVLTQARRAAVIVQDLLAYSRPSVQGRLPIPLEEIVHEALQSMEASLREKNIAVAFVAPAKPALVAADRKLLLQVFHNVILNAEQAISAARTRGSLKISFAVTDARVGVTFTDDGPGIPPDIIRKVFDPFFTTKRPGGGSGLGLTICLAVVKDHGGTLEAHSQPGAGATFEISFPAIVELSQAKPAARPTSESAVPGSEPLHGHSVLIVDDEESIREIVQEGLAMRGMKIECAASSEEALERLAANSYEVVLCDMNLPGISGEQLLRRVRAQGGPAGPQFVLMTGELVESGALEPVAGHEVRILQKPFHISALSALLIEMLAAQTSKVGPA
jgi:PAS domain S-box-containing protein